jgi:adenylosuccinate lyase
MPEPDTGPGAYDAALEALRSHERALAAALDVWQDRDAQDARARRCANDAMDAIDAALRELHDMRNRLTGEIRAYDDATAARVDELLRKDRGEAGQ